MALEVIKAHIYVDVNVMAWVFNVSKPVSEICVCEKGNWSHYIDWLYS